MWLYVKSTSKIIERFYRNCSTALYTTMILAKGKLCETPDVLYISVFNNLAKWFNLRGFQAFCLESQEFRIRHVLCIRYKTCSHYINLSLTILFSYKISLRYVSMAMNKYKINIHVMYRSSGTSSWIARFANIFSLLHPWHYQ